MHGSPDGPWFFIIARSLAATGQFQLIGITDTAMLRPQVFALQEGEVSSADLFGKQAIDATLDESGKRGQAVHADRRQVLNARGGSHTDAARSC